MIHNTYSTQKCSELKALKIYDIITLKPKIEVAATVFTFFSSRVQVQKKKVSALEVKFSFHLLLLNSLLFVLLIIIKNEKHLYF